MTSLDRKIVNEMNEEITDYVLSDEFGEFIDLLLGLDTDEDIINKALGGNCYE